MPRYKDPARWAVVVLGGVVFLIALGLAWMALGFRGVDGHEACAGMLGIALAAASPFWLVAWFLPAKD